MDPNLTLLLIAIINAGTAYMAWRTHGVAVEAKDIALKTELNTNSMREQLVTATDKASHAAGKEEGRVESEAKAATFAQGKLDAKI